MTITIQYTPAILDFGGVLLSTTGPDITPDPTFGPPGISFAGGVQIKSVPADAMVTAAIVEGQSIFRVRDIIALDWVWQDVDPGELPPGHRGPPPKTKVLQVSAQSDGGSPLAVTAGQYLLVRVAYQAPVDDDDDTPGQDSDGDAGSDLFGGTLVITGDGWEPITVPLSLFLAFMQTIVSTPTPIVLVQGGTADVEFWWQIDGIWTSTVRYEMSPTQLHSGVSIIGQNEFAIGRDPPTHILRLAAAIDAPLGDNTLAVNQFYLNTRAGFLIPVTITAPA